MCAKDALLAGSSVSASGFPVSELMTNTCTFSSTSHLSLNPSLVIESTVLLLLSHNLSQSL